MVKKTLFAENYPMQTLSRSDQKTVLRLALELELVTTAAWIISILFSRFGSSSSMKGIFIWVRISIPQLVNFSTFSGETEILSPSSTVLSLLQGWTLNNSKQWGGGSVHFKGLIQSHLDFLNSLFLFALFLDNFKLKQHIGLNVAL